MRQHKAISESRRRWPVGLVGAGIAAVVLVAVALTPARAGTIETGLEYMSNRAVVAGLIATAIAVPVGVADDPGNGIDCGQVSDTPGGVGFVAIAAGWKHSVALKSDGTIVAWGDDYNAQVRGAPQGADYTAISAYGDFSLALRTDGSIVSWGYNFPGDQIVPPAETGFAAVDTGYDCGFALRADGSIVGFGLSGRPEEAPVGTGFVQVAGAGGGVAIGADASLTCWGNDWSGQVSNAPTAGVYTAVDAAPSYCLALRDDGTIAAWGEDDGDQYWDFGQVTDTPEGDSFTAIAAGPYHALALKEDGSIVAWGRDGYGQVRDVPEGEFVAIAAGAYHSLALRADGSIAAWGVGVDQGCEVLTPVDGLSSLPVRGLSPMVHCGLIPEPTALVLVVVGGVATLMRRR